VQKVYFFCSDAETLLSQCGVAEVESLSEAREHAAMVASSLMATGGPEDWRDWSVHVSDDLGDELVRVPFSSVLGRVH
jgi:uncharacterized protein DUF6894